tara:strand:- start:1149 stop:1553 length:405 start_codon:yes stop_codon:yes gene_type:complete
MKICIVVSDYYKEISNNLLEGSIEQLKKNKFKKLKIKFVSGAFEIPNIISKNIKKFDAFIALGCIIKGETDHYYFISNAVSTGLMNLSIQSKKPIGFGILTCNNLKQAKVRSSILKKNKGKEVALGIISILKNK